MPKTDGAVHNAVTNHAENLPNTDEIARCAMKKLHRKSVMHLVENLKAAVKCEHRI